MGIRHFQGNGIFARCEEGVLLALPVVLHQPFGIGIIAQVDIFHRFAGPVHLLGGGEFGHRLGILLVDDIDALRVVQHQHLHTAQLIVIGIGNTGQIGQPGQLDQERAVHNPGNGREGNIHAVLYNGLFIRGKNDFMASRLHIDGPGIIVPIHGEAQCIAYKTGRHICTAVKNSGGHVQHNGLAAYHRFLMIQVQQHIMRGCGNSLSPYRPQHLTDNQHQRQQQPLGRRVSSKHSFSLLLVDTLFSN
ncbi:hypothetical protein D3C75_750690 [compost metagenome]